MRMVPMDACAKEGAQSGVEVKVGYFMPMFLMGN